MSGTSNELNPLAVEASPEPEGTSGASTVDAQEFVRNVSSAGVQSISPVEIARDEEVPSATAGTGAGAPASQSWNEKTLLTCDGGGIRGYASLLMIEQLMVHIGRIEQNHQVIHLSNYKPCVKPLGLHKPGTGFQEGALNTEYFPCHYFDYMMGTSTGGLIVTMLSRWRMPIVECLKKYEEVGKKIFEKRRKISVLGYPQTKHSKRPLIRAIEALCNERTPQNRTPPLPHFEMFPAPEDLCRTAVFSIQKGKGTGLNNEDERIRTQDGPFIFRSYKLDERTFAENFPPLNYGAKIEYEIWKVCRATTAAPIYFEPQIIDDEEYCDGGAGVNNPTLKAHNELNSLHTRSTRVVASFGTGKPEGTTMFRGREWHRLHIGQAIAGINRLLKTAKARLTDCEETHEEVLARQNLLLNGPAAFDYFRFNVDHGLGKMKLNEWKVQRDNGEGGKCTTLEYIRKCTEEELRKPETIQRLTALATLLVDRRRQRVKDDPDMWERFACCSSYRCTDDSCQTETGDRFSVLLRRDMREHLQTRHNCDPEAMEARLDCCRQMPEVPAGPF